MSDFNAMTVVAAAEVLSDFKSHAELELLEIQWGIAGICRTSSKPAHAADIATLAIDQSRVAMTERGLVSLRRAVVEAAVSAPPVFHTSPVWQKLVAGLRFDGYELVEHEIESPGSAPWAKRTERSVQLARMLPTDVPGLDFPETESEIVALLSDHGFSTSLGHLRQAISAFSRGEWSSANGELRNFFESYLNAIADRLGYQGTGDSKARRDFLGASLLPPLSLGRIQRMASRQWEASIRPGVDEPHASPRRTSGAVRGGGCDIPSPDHSGHRTSLLASP